MKEIKSPGVIWLPIKVSLFAVLLLVCCFSCHEKAGDPNKFTVLSFDQLTATNSPKGIVLKDGKVTLADGFGLEYSADSTMALLIGPGKNGGGLAMRCDCDGLIKLGCMVVTEPIFTCKPLLCTSCKPVLLLYDGIVTIDKFREAAKKTK